MSGAVLGDTNRHLMGFYKAVKDDPLRLSTALNEIANMARATHGETFRELYYKLRREFPRGELFENAALFLFLNRHCWNGLYRENAHGIFNTPIGSYQALQHLPSPDQLVEASRVLRDATLLTSDFEDTLQMARVGDLIYFDPPYVPSSTTARFSQYQGQSFNWRDQIRLKKKLYELVEKKIDFILSNSFQPLTASFYRDFHQHVVCTTGTISSSASSRAVRKELLITSFPTKLVHSVSV